MTDSGMVYCSLSSYIGNNDTISSDVVSEAVTGGSIDLFDVYEYDLVSYKACSVNAYSNGEVSPPTQALYIFERGNTVLGTYYTVPSFDSSNGVNFYGYTYYGGSYHGILDSYNAGVYNTWSMWNPDNNGYHNIGLSTVMTNSSFNEYFNTASGT
jgi:hypothetical protein